MSPFNRREFFQNAAIGVAGVLASPLIKNYENIFAKTINDISVFKPFPHPWMPKMNFVYLTDEHDEPFKSAVQVNQSGIAIPEELGSKKFNVNTRWFVEDFGFIYLSADNGGQSYSVKDLSKSYLNLNYEFAKSRLIRNRKIKEQYLNRGVKFSNELNHLHSLSEELFEDSTRKINDSEKCASYSDTSLKYSLFTGEKIEIEYAQYEINKQKRKDDVHFGCESRQMVWAKSEEFIKRFPELFNYSTITHYVWDSWYEQFEPKEGKYNWGIKDDIINFLMDNNIKVEGRPLSWFHPTVTPDWLKQKSFSELKAYVEKHTKDLVSHYGDKVQEWEVINEYHDWANIFNHSPEQITEIVKLACDKTKETNPKVRKLLNNCAPWGEYVARGRMARMDATRPLRTVKKYIEDLLSADVDFDVLGIQIYYPGRDLSDIVRLIEKFEKFNKPISITEIGASSGPSNETVFNGQLKLPSAPYEWRRPWDEDLQADWLEAVYTIYYSRPLIKTINWYDFSDFRPFIVNGGIVREDCTTKMSFDRLKNLLGSWNRLPALTKS